MASGKDTLVYIVFFAVTQLTEKRNEFNLPTYIAFIDYIKAFDVVNRNKLWQILALKGFPQYLT
jgi:hypothetical protein